MAKSQNQKLKLIYLARLMQEKTDDEHGLSMSEIISELRLCGVKAERKSIYDDFEALRSIGMDIEKNIIGNRTEYYLAGRELNESIYYTVDDIHNAINRDKQIAFKYFKWNADGEKELRRGGKTYQVSPWALTWDDENYYLVAFDAEVGMIKHYRVDKMMKMAVLQERREGAQHFKNFDMALYSKKMFGMYNGRDEFVTLRCKNQMADPIINRFGQDVLLRKVSGEDSFDVTVKVAVSPVFLTWVMNFGGDIKILSPDHVAKEQVELAKKIIAAYE